jgi:sulfite reductase (NADPH) flavoprotein alpha-component
VIIERRPPAQVPLLPENAPFTPSQRAWLNGFFAGLLTPGVTAAPMEPAAPKPKLTVLHASQTGTAEGLAKKLAKAARERGLEASAMELGSASLESLAQLGCFAVVASTYGEGDPPDGAKAFADALQQASGTPLSGSSYAVLALGDRNYTHFCRFGLTLDERFAALGGERLLERHECDVDVDAPFAQFRDGFLRAVEAAAPVAQPTAATPAEPGYAEGEDRAACPWSRTRPYPATVLANVNLNAPGSDIETRHVVLSLGDSGLTYAPGDAIGVVPANAPEAVDAILEASRLDGATPVEIDSSETMPLAYVLTNILSIGKLAQPTLIKFQALAESQALARLLDADNVAELDAYLWGRELIDLLAEYPGVVASADALVSLLPKLTPRLYSISSSQRADPEQVHITVGLVRYTSYGRARHGVASRFLAEGGCGGTVPVCVHPNARFRLPEDSNRPVVMIGPGTGIAPFRAFLQERRALGSRGQAWLFFGHRRGDCDFLYRQELEDFLDAGTLARLDTAFSREGTEKVYVQHRMLEFGRELWTWICGGAHVYVCGDAARMARDVDRALHAILMKHGRLSEAKAKIELQALAAERRYCRDVY